MIKRLLNPSRATWLLSAALVLSIGLAAPAAVYAAAQPLVNPYAMTPRRIGSSLTVLVALIAAIVGGRALARAAGRPRDAILALVLGPLSLISGVLVVATAKGGLGTGNGLAGGVVAILIGLIGATLGGLALARSRRTG